MKKLFLLLLLAAGVLFLFFHLFRFEPSSRYTFSTPASKPVPEERIPFSKVAKGVSNYLCSVEFSIRDMVPEEIALEDLALYEKSLQLSKGLRDSSEISASLRSVFSEVRELRSKLIKSISKLLKLALMEKGLMDTEESFSRRIELRRYNLENEIDRDVAAVLARLKKLQSQCDRLVGDNPTLTLPISDSLVSALASKVDGPASRGYPPPLDEAPTKGKLKICEAQVLSVTAEGTIALEMEYVSGPVSYLQSIGGGGGHVPLIAVPGTKVLYFQGLRHGVAKDQRINVLARQGGVFEYTSANGNRRAVERWNFIRFVAQR